MPKKPESVLGLTPVSNRPNFEDHGYIIPLDSTQPSNQDEQWILCEYKKQALIMQGVEAKELLALKLIAEIHKEGVVTFDEAAGQILRLKDNQRTKEHQAYIEEFSTRAIQLMARHLLATAEVAATNIGVEVHRTIYPSLPGETPSLWKRLFG